MSRFSNLEFQEDENRQNGSEVVKDESFYINEGREFFRRGRFEEALRSYSKVLEFNPQNAAAWTAQVQMLIELGEFREARMWADKALEKFPEEPELLAAKAVSLGRMGDYGPALAFSDASVEEKGITPYIWLARADVLMARREKRADYCFEKAFSLAPTDWFIHWLAARIHMFYKKFSLAMTIVEQSLKLDPGRAVVWVELGECQAALGFASMARASFDQARELDPGIPMSDNATSAGILERVRHRLKKLIRIT